MHALRRVTGTTLVELLVAVSIMALMAGLAGRTLHGMTQAQGAMERQADEVLTLQAGLVQWGADLDAMTLLPHATSLDWNGRVVRIVRRAMGQSDAGVCVVAWTQHQGQWLRWQSSHLTTRGDVEAAWEQADLWSRAPVHAQGQHEVSVTPLQAWHLFFFQGGSWSNPLSSYASESNPADFVANTYRSSGALLPDGVRLVLELPPGQAVSGRVIRDWVSPRLGGGKS